MAEKICPYCGASINEFATRCPNCQRWLGQSEAITDISKPQDFLATLLFAYFLGCCGVHRFWTGYTAIGIAQLLTFGGCGIWTLVDIVAICFNKYKDYQGRNLRNYDRSTGVVVFVLVLIPMVLMLLLLTVVLGLIAAGN